MSDLGNDVADRIEYVHCEILTKLRVEDRVGKVNASIYLCGWVYTF